VFFFPPFLFAMMYGKKGLCITFTAICSTCRIIGPNVLVCSSLDSALQKLQEPPLAETVESAWVIGGSSVYKVCNYCLFHKILLQVCKSIVF
jgi:dihydrofolate reductase